MWSMVVEYFGDRKVSALLVVLLAVGAYYAHGWLDMNFVSTAQANEKFEDLGKRVDANGRAIEALDDKIDLISVRRDIKDNRNQQYALSAQIEQTGTTSLSNKRQKELDDSLTDLDKREQCLLLKQDNC